LAVCQEPGSKEHISEADILSRSHPAKAEVPEASTGYYVWVWWRRRMREEGSRSHRTVGHQLVFTSCAKTNQFIVVALNCG
jgi:hypothetical protein